LSTARSSRCSPRIVPEVIAGTVPPWPAPRRRHRRTDASPGNPAILWLPSISTPPGRCRDAAGAPRPRRRTANPSRQPFPLPAGIADPPTAERPPVVGSCGGPVPARLAVRPG